jgi:hypothetical protein
MHTPPTKINTAWTAARSNLSVEASARQDQGRPTREARMNVVLGFLVVILVAAITVAAMRWCAEFTRKTGHLGSRSLHVSACLAVDVAQNCAVGIRSIALYNPSLANGRVFTSRRPFPPVLLPDSSACFHHKRRQDRCRD